MFWTIAANCPTRNLRRGGTYPQGATLAGVREALLPLNSCPGGGTAILFPAGYFLPGCSTHILRL